MLWAPKGPFSTDYWSQLMSSARHTLSNQQAQLKQLRLVNLTENAAQHTFKLLVRLLLDAVANDLLFVKTINVSID